jgi:uncharacterized protein YjaG (DUF416 family)
MKTLKHELSEIIHVIQSAEALNNNASDHNRDVKKFGVTWYEYRSLTQAIKKTLATLIDKHPDLRKG